MLRVFCARDELMAISAESVPRAVASVVPPTGYQWEPRSLPLAVLIRAIRISENYTLSPLRRRYGLQSGEAKVCADGSPKIRDASWGQAAGESSAQIRVIR